MKKQSVILLACSILLLCAMLLTTVLIDRSIRSKEAAVLATATAYVPDRATEPSTEPTQPKTTPAPDFTVTGKDKKDYTLADFKGKPVILCFWNIASADELDRMEQLQKTYGDRAHIVAVHMTTVAETRAKALAFLKAKSYTFSVYFDTTGETVVDYQVSVAPTTYFITANGDLTARAKGALNPDTLPQALATIGLS